MHHNIVLAQTIRSWLQGVFDILFPRQSLFQFQVPASVQHLMVWRQRRRLPVILQLTITECGAACLAMILSYYGRETGVAEIRSHTDVGRNGLTARTIAQTARTFGLRVKGYSAEPADFNYLHLPAIIHWRFEHFVIVERWSSERVDIVDPAMGRRTLTPDEFESEFTGVVLTFEPGAHFIRRSEAGRSYWRLYLQQALSMPGMAKLLVQILGVSLFLQLFGLAIPLFTKVLVDDILPLALTSLMPMLGLGLLVLILSQLVANYLRAGLLIYLQARLDAQLMLNFFEHVLSLPFAFFQQRSSGDLLMRLSSNATIRQMLTSQTLSIVLDGLFVLVYLILIFAQEALFGWLVLALGLAQIALLLGTHRTMHGLTQRQLIAQAESQSYLVEALGGIATLKASGGEERSLDHWSNLFFTQLNASLRQNHLAAVVETVLSTFRTFSPLLLLWIGAGYVLAGTWSLGNMLALSALAVAILTPLASLVSAGRQLQLARAHMERISDVLLAEAEQDEMAVQLAPALSGQIELDQVSFQYNADTPLVLRDISLTVQPGQKVALVGRTGCGKSTLAKLLIGLYRPTNGEIRYDGLPLQRLNLRSLRRQFGAVLQESFLFNGSIRQNIAFNEPALTLEEVVTAAQMAAIDQDIMEMPMRYETLVAEGGSGLSGGQRQRLALARALAHKPTILLLDEATSHLDVATEQIVEQNLDRLKCTRIVIAHRLSTIHNADLILVLDEGRIIEQGTHDDLLAVGGNYANLVHRQPKWEDPVT